jgi:hypothetical protein
MPDSLEAPVEEGTAVGTIAVYYKGEPIGSVRAVTASDVATRSTEDLDREIRMEKFKALAVSSAKYIGAGIVLVLVIFVLGKLISLLTKKRKNKKLYEGKKRKTRKNKKNKKKTKYKIEF